MSVEEYVRVIGGELEATTDREGRIRLAQALAATGSPDAQPYLVEALAEEGDDEVVEALRQALRDLEARQD